MYAPVRMPEQNARRTKHGVRPWLRGVRHSDFGAPSHAVPLSNGTSIDDKPAVSIALIDPKPLTRQSLLNLLAASFAEHVSLVGASSFDELSEFGIEAEPSSEAKFNFIILYIRSAGVTDDWVQRQLQLIKGQAHKIPVIMISDRDDSDDVVNALNCGIRGYIPTSIAAEVAIAALTLIEAGGTYIPPGALRSEGPETQGHADPPPSADPALELGLTTRELAVIDLLREGNANKVIAKRLDMRESTVKVHVRNILKKLRVTNRTHAATVANRLLGPCEALATTPPAKRQNGLSDP